MVTGRGAVRPHWQNLFAVLTELGPEGLAQRGERARQQLEDDGITFNLYSGNLYPGHQQAGDLHAGSPSGAPRPQPWALDPVPLVIDPVEWRQIEHGIKQRARLLDRILADLYGPQSLLASRRYPPALVYGHPEFLRSCRRAGPALPGQFVQHYAADLARGPDGRWRVVADRVQAPAGAAFALHHRRVLARVMGEAHQACRVRPLAGFFDRWTEDLHGRASSGAGNPRIVVLTPGPYNEAHVEHAALARELGATLVEGSDLTARDGRVFIKTLGGLEPIDVLLRRVDGAWCDPLELRADSAIGVCGLVEAVRCGGVVCANAIGSGMVEAPAIGAFLPGLAEHLLGDELALPSVATWWCGQDYALEAVLDRLDSLALRPALVPGARTINGGDLGANERAALIAALRARPMAFAAQERIAASVAPGLAPAGLQPQAVVLRVFAVAQGAEHVVMPGGLARIPAGDDPLRGGLQHGGINKDVWVSGEDSFDPAVPLRRIRIDLAIRRTHGEVSSRSADDLFWLGRNVERLDTGGRVLRAALQRLVGGMETARDQVELAALARVLARGGLAPLAMATAPPGGAAMRGALLTAFSPGSLLDGALAAIERLASAARDRFSIDMRRTLHHLLGELRGRQARDAGDADRLLALLDQLVRLSAAVAGLANENMTRGSGWRFLDLGRRIERGIHVARVVLGVAAIPRASWPAALHLALELCDSTISYRTRYLATLLEAPVFDLVLLDPTNPQSLGFQIAGMRAHLAALPALPGAPDGDAVNACLARIAMLVAADGAAARQPVAALTSAVEAIEAGLLELSDALGRAWFAHVPQPRVFGAE
jgi:uncharacterized circularly permuted ATP-grasp superfamily protein/uncharacterized alpha-E superfamily protein